MWTISGVFNRASMFPIIPETTQWTPRMHSGPPQEYPKITLGTLSDHLWDTSGPPQNYTKTNPGSPQDHVRTTSGPPWNHTKITQNHTKTTLWPIQSHLATIPGPPQNYFKPPRIDLGPHQDHLLPPRDHPWTTQRPDNHPVVLKFSLKKVKI